MKFIEKVELVVKLKERIAEVQSSNTTLAQQLQSLLDNIVSTPGNSPVI